MENLSISKQLFYQLAEQLKKNIVGLSVSETDKWCGFYQKGGKRFAYILLAKRKPKIDVWCLGDVDYIHKKYGSKIKFKLRQKTSGEFGKNFQISFVIENSGDIENAVLLLTDISDSWSREELISAYNLYCRIPIKEINSKNTNIIQFANLLSRTPKEIAKRFKNFSKLDANVSIQKGIEEEDKNTWIFFNNDWRKSVYESENKIIDFENKLKNIVEFPKGKERDSIVKSRINQNFFRSAVLTSYQNKCCITGLPFVELLNASHIVPWSIDDNNRLNPRNGLCLNVLHDRAFDRGLITIRTDYTIDISSRINNFLDCKSINDYFLCFKNQKIILPQRFVPEKSFLEFHNKNIFKK
ncbi:MAG: putative restriction endonuclease [Parcubacteria group bacterium Licking1014_1]|nr:MAG: putative restriction endonuclease [Parcubacteria group bacterium Licking1014_1]